jgi:hypothetical protein
VAAFSQLSSIGCCHLFGPVPLGFVPFPSAFLLAWRRDAACLHSHSCFNILSFCFSRSFSPSYSLSSFSSTGTFDPLRSRFSKLAIDVPPFGTWCWRRPPIPHPQTPLLDSRYTRSGQNVKLYRPPNCHLSPIAIFSEAITTASARIFDRLPPPHTIPIITDGIRFHLGIQRSHHNSQKWKFGTISHQMS